MTHEDGCWDSCMDGFHGSGWHFHKPFEHNLFQDKIPLRSSTLAHACSLLSEHLSSSLLCKRLKLTTQFMCLWLYLTFKCINHTGRFVYLNYLHRFFF